MRRVGAAGVAGALSVALAIAACTAQGPAPDRARAHLVWTRVELPGGAEPVALATAGRTLLVGGDRSGQTPTMDVLTAGPSGEPSAFHSLDITCDPGSPYAPLARWRSITLRGQAVTAIGGAAGGAHSNTRWTTWAGELDGDAAGTLRERPQSFYAFGGYGAGELLDAVATDAGTYLVGTWNGTTGLDAAVWHEQGLRWVRAKSAGSALASTPTSLVGAVAATSNGPGILILGNVTWLGGAVAEGASGGATGDEDAGGPGTVAGAARRTAAVWRSSHGATGWQRVDLPGGGSGSEARSATCGLDGCVVAGVVDGRYALWWLPKDGPASRLEGVPTVAVGDHDSVPAPVRSGAEHVWPGADLLFTVGDVVGSRAGGVWTTSPSSGQGHEAAAVGQWLYVIAARGRAVDAQVPTARAAFSGNGGLDPTAALWRGRMVRS
ncbi:MAG: hypothetical protein Q4P32_01795 [Micrococcales bacterium]|nr:hypothetical protein [Micrococcales bacterium]